jgi:uncharacterized protein (UPF0333 family)
MKAQISSEFLVVFAALLMIFLVIFAIYFGGSLNLFQVQDIVAALRNAYAIASAINYVHLAGDGASYNFTVSGVANDENINITDYAVTSARHETTIGAPLLNGNVNTTWLGRGSVIITNNGGEIDIGK